MEKTSSSKHSEYDKDSSDTHSTTSGVEYNSSSYGKDIWDSLPLLTENTSNRTNLMKCLRNFFVNYKKAFDTFH